MDKPRWTIEKFLPLYLQAAAEGITKEEFAEQLGIKPDTVYQRVYALRRKGADLPLLRSAGKVPVMEQATKIIEAFKAKGKAPAVSPRAETADDVNGELDAASSEDIESILGVGK